MYRRLCKCKEWDDFNHLYLVRPLVVLLIRQFLPIMLRSRQLGCTTHRMPLEGEQLLIGEIAFVSTTASLFLPFTHLSRCSFLLAWRLEDGEKLSPLNISQNMLFLNLFSLWRKQEYLYPGKHILGKFIFSESKWLLIKQDMHNLNCPRIFWMFLERICNHRWLILTDHVYSKR